MITAQIAPPPAACSQTARDLPAVGAQTPPADPPSPIRPIWYSPHQLSAYWGCPKRSILALIKSGALPAHRVNRRVIRIAAVDAAAHVAGAAAAQLVTTRNNFDGAGSARAFIRSEVGGRSR